MLVVEDKIVELVTKPPAQDGIKISSNIYNILLVLKEILANMGIHAEVCEHNKNLEGSEVYYHIQDLVDDWEPSGNCHVNCQSTLDSGDLKDSVDRIQSKEASCLL